MSTQSSAVLLPVSSDAKTEARLKALPKSAQKKYEHLRRVELRSRALVEGLLEERQRIREHRDDAARDLAHFDRLHRPESAFTIEEDAETGMRKRVPAVFPEREAIVQKIENLNAELQRLAHEQSVASVGFSTNALLDWISKQSSPLIAVPAPLVKPAKGESVAEALSRNREAQAELRDRLSAAKNTRRTIAEAKAAMREQVARVAARGQAEISALFHNRPIVWPTETLVAHGYGGQSTVVSTTINDAFAFTVWANQQAVICALEAEIERRGDDATALSREAQAERVGECESALVQLQRQEEAIIERLEAQGQYVTRLCANPMILLGIEVGR